MIICRVTGVLVSRFLLDLQHVNREAVGLGTSISGDGGAASRGGTQGDSLVFERIVGSIASSIEFNVDDEADPGRDDPDADVHIKDSLLDSSGIPPLDDQEKLPVISGMAEQSVIGDLVEVEVSKTGAGKLDVKEVV